MGSQEKLRLAEVIGAETIVPALKASKKDQAIRELTQALADAGAIPKAKVKEIAQGILDREKLGSTGIGKGIAVPHAKLAGFKAPLGAMGKSEEGIDFSSLDGGLAHTIFLFISPAEPPEMHVQLMSRFVTLIRKPDFTHFLAQTDGQKELHEFLKEVDEW